ncbi:PREDICTED: uncharacterized protein LOC104587214 isoform X2 [Nelumbo nucifera]|uniref:Uncharacterized protein LOC104587214 isoform X1 n=1 Tax=Nelumbo nucifera TaxID=4432 RepID=A0A1U7Z6A8_NELNU|nr:PREDICTED: uncharacterized protein LOC104587214 isoform X1 [Nelumbo nucifera]XP_010243046.1 PREDICTED: uncharacterized protein LOC104587214 isoform X2 [Nelumbo nucifera]
MASLQRHSAAALGTQHWALASNPTVNFLEQHLQACNGNLPATKPDYPNPLGNLIRLTFWLSNSVVLRAIISQVVGESQLSICADPQIEANGGKMGNEKKSSPLKWNESSLNKKEKFVFFFSNDFDDWEDPHTFVTALEKVEAWIFSRIIESVWWQVMEQCMNRLDVAMFNAILRESADEIPTDPVSDPISDSKVLPTPVGKSSFGNGAQLKNAVWCAQVSAIHLCIYSVLHRRNKKDDNPGTATTAFALK